MITYPMRSLALAACFSCLLLTACETRVDDAVLTARIKTEMTADGRISPSRVNVDTLNGIVTLKGEVPTQQEKDAAAEVTGKVAGVKRVDNQLIVNPATAGTGLPTGNEIKDKAKEAATEVAAGVKQEATDTVLSGTIKTRLFAAGYNNVAVSVNRAEAVLTGEVATEKDRTAVEAIVSKISGVTKTTNQTTVKGAKPTPTPSPRR